MKKLLACLLALMLFVPTAFAAPAYEDALPGYYKPPKANEGQYPIKEEGVSLTYWMPILKVVATFIPSYDENPAYQKAQKDTGVDIQFIHPAAGTEKETFQLSLGGELPDMYLLPRGSYYDGDLQAMYDDGLIIDLTPYMEEYAPQYMEIINSNELAQAQCYSDGKILGMYKITYAPKIPYIRVNTNADWLAEAGMTEEPNTIAEYEAYFDWILANKPGVVPLYIGNFTSTSAMFMNIFTGAYDFLFDWYLPKDDPTKIAYWANAPQLKEFVTLMHNWYEKGYLGKDFLSLTSSEVYAMFDQGKYACYVGSTDGCYSRQKSRGEEGLRVTNFPYMRMAEDSVIGSGLANNPVGDGGEYVTVITTACENVEAAIQYLNYGYTYEGSITHNFGVEGQAYEWGEKGFPEFTTLMTNNHLGLSMGQCCYMYKNHFSAKYCYPDDIGLPTLANDPEGLAVRTRWAVDTNEQNWLQIPPLKLTVEESAERSELMTQVDTYAKEMLVLYITGAKDLDTFDAYLTDIGNYGLNRAKEIMQGALDRYLEDNK